MPVLRKRNLGMGWLWSAPAGLEPASPLYAMRRFFPLSYVHNKPRLRPIRCHSWRAVQRFSTFASLCSYNTTLLSQKTCKVSKEKGGAIAPPVLSFFILRLFLFPLFYEWLIQLFFCGFSCRRRFLYRIKISKVKLLAAKSYISSVFPTARAIRHATDPRTTAARCRCRADLIDVRTLVELWLSAPHRSRLSQAHTDTPAPSRGVGTPSGCGRPCFGPSRTARPS